MDAKSLSRQQDSPFDFHYLKQSVPSVADLRLCRMVLLAVHDSSLTTSAAERESFRSIVVTGAFASLRSCRTCV